MNTGYKIVLPASFAARCSQVILANVMVPKAEYEISESVFTDIPFLSSNS